jgi:hypothetical protein
MNPQTDTTSSIGDVITGAAAWPVALGILTMTLFPLAIPGIVLAVVPLVLLAVVVGLLAAVAAAPVMAVSGLRRRAAARRDRAGYGAATARPS